MKPSDWPLYHFRATVRRIRDGDTIEVDIDFGGPRKLREQWPIRLLGYNAPEVVGESRAEGLAARDALALILPVGCRVYLRTHLDRTNFDRMLANVYVEGSDGDLYDVAEAMISGGYGEVA